MEDVARMRSYFASLHPTETLTYFSGGSQLFVRHRHSLGFRPNLYIVPKHVFEPQYTFLRIWEMSRVEQEPQPQNSGQPRSGMQG